MSRRVEPALSVDEVAAARRHFREALDELADASADLAQLAVRVRETAEVGKAHLEGGGSVTDIPTVIHLDVVRADLEAALARFNAARMRTRRHTVTLATTEGASLSDLARRFGVSRQYMSKLLREHRQDEQTS